MTEKSSSDVSLDDFVDGPIEYNEVDAEIEDAFLRDLGINEEYRSVDRKPTRTNEQTPNKFMDIQTQHDSTAPKYMTPGGKELKAVKDPWGTFWKIQFTDGGQLPNELKGSYTNTQEAHKAIEVYLAKKEA